MPAERGFVVAAVLLEVAAASVRPPLLIAMREVAHAPKGRFGWVRVLVVLPVVVGFLVVRVVVNRVLELPGNIVVGLVQELDQAVDLVPSLCVGALWPERPLPG